MAVAQTQAGQTFAQALQTFALSDALILGRRYEQKTAYHQGNCKGA